ncbi:hypothetical protein [Pseudomonas savastanoi]|uniref:hypothetical protein n=1 Tax=Pseudomonas savastanoi TaxID=29438 RepID=UPI000E3280D4|nr:hypothetical protein [Pseudomonas savastanoi]
MTSTIHFYDGQYLGTPSQGQLVSFDSLTCGGVDSSRYSERIALRADVAFSPENVEQLDCFDLDFSTGVTEYEWSRTAQELFARPNTLHVGIGNTSALDHFIRYSLYRSLSTLPNTLAPDGAHFIDLLTVCRAITLLRPTTMPFELPVEWGEQRKRELVQRIYERSSRADTVLALARSIWSSSPKLMSHAVAHSAPAQIGSLCGLIDGQIDSLAALRPVFICHEHLLADERWGIFLALGTDPQYANIIYMVDLQCDLSDLVLDAGASVTRFIRTQTHQSDRPIIRVNLNRIPFVSPLGVIDSKTASRLRIDAPTVKRNAAQISLQHDICLALMEVSGASENTLKGDPDYQLYGAEYLESDCHLLNRLHASPRVEWAGLVRTAHDSRITALGDRLIRRLEPALLNETEVKEWYAHCASRLMGNADSGRRAEAMKYCSTISGSDAYPIGMRAAAQHWLKTVEIWNESRNNV